MRKLIGSFLLVMFIISIIPSVAYSADCPWKKNDSYATKIKKFKKAYGVPVAKNISYMLMFDTYMMKQCCIDCILDLVDRNLIAFVPSEIVTFSNDLFNMVELSESRRFAKIDFGPDYFNHPVWIPWDFIK